MRNLVFLVIAACAAPNTLPSVDTFDWIRAPLTAHVAMCLAANGEVTRVGLVGSSGEPQYDAAVVHDIRHWQLAAPGRAVCSKKAITYLP